MSNEIFAVLMLVHRLLRRPNIKPTSVQRLLFAGDEQEEDCVFLLTQEVAPLVMSGQDVPFWELH